MKKYQNRQIWVYFRKLTGTSGNKIKCRDWRSAVGIGNTKRFSDHALIALLYLKFEKQEAALFSLLYSLTLTALPSQTSKKDENPFQK